MNGNEWHFWLVIYFLDVILAVGYLGSGSAQPHRCCFRVCTQPISRIGWQSCM